MNVHTFVSTPIGDLLLLADDACLRGLYFPDHWYPPRSGSLGARAEAAAHPVLGDAARQLAEYFAGERQRFDLPVAVDGSERSQAIWRRLREIPYGATTTYGAIALELGDRNLAQLVGQAVGHNPISIVIPCHRVVGADGSLTGFAGGIDRKRFLLELEEPDEIKAGRLF